MDDRDATEDLERLLMAFQERLLPLGGVGPVDCLARERQPHREQKALRPDPRQLDPKVREVDLTFRAGIMGLRDERLWTALPAAARISGRRLAT